MEFVPTESVLQKRLKRARIDKRKEAHMSKTPLTEPAGPAASAEAQPEDTRPDDEVLRELLEVRPTRNLTPEQAATVAKLVGRFNPILPDREQQPVMWAVGDRARRGCQGSIRLWLQPRVAHMPYQRPATEEQIPDQICSWNGIQLICPRGRKRPYEIPYAIWEILDQQDTSDRALGL